MPIVSGLAGQSLSFGATEATANVVFTVKAYSYGRSLLDDPQTTTRFNARLRWQKKTSWVGLSFDETALSLETRRDQNKPADDYLRLEASARQNLGGKKKAYRRLFVRYEGYGALENEVLSLGAEAGLDALTNYDPQRGGLKASVRGGVAHFWSLEDKAKNFAQRNVLAPYARIEATLPLSPEAGRSGKKSHPYAFASQSALYHAGLQAGDSKLLRFMEAGVGYKTANGWDFRLAYRDGRELPSYDIKHGIELWVTAPLSFGAK